MPEKILLTYASRTGPTAGEAMLISGSGDILILI